MDKIKIIVTSSSTHQETIDKWLADTQKICNVKIISSSTHGFLDSFKSDRLVTNITYETT